MPINEEITGNGESAVTSSTKDISDVIVEGNGKGQIQLLGRIPGGKWMLVTDRTGHLDIATPDPAIEYMFQAVDVKVPVRVYFGP